METVTFKTGKGEVLEGRIVQKYRCFEGYIRYIICTAMGRTYRCRCHDGEYTEEII